MNFFKCFCVITITFFLFAGHAVELDADFFDPFETIKSNEPLLLEGFNFSIVFGSRILPYGDVEIQFRERGERVFFVKGNGNYAGHPDGYSIEQVRHAIALRLKDLDPATLHKQRQKSTWRGFKRGLKVGLIAGLGADAPILVNKLIALVSGDAHVGFAALAVAPGCLTVAGTVVGGLIGRVIANDRTGECYSKIITALDQLQNGVNKQFRHVSLLRSDAEKAVGLLVATMDTEAIIASRQCAQTFASQSAPLNSEMALP